MAPPQRLRFNAKARGSVAGGSSHKKKRRVKKDEGVDSNVVEVVPKSAGEKEMERAERMRQEVSIRGGEGKVADAIGYSLKPSRILR